jgi:hypothetical protein
MHTADPVGRTGTLGGFSARVKRNRTFTSCLSLGTIFTNLGGFSRSSTLHLASTVLAVHHPSLSRFGRQLLASDESPLGRGPWLHMSETRTPENPGRIPPSCEAANQLGNPTCPWSNFLLHPRPLPARDMKRTNASYNTSSPSEHRPLACKLLCRPTQLPLPPTPHSTGFPSFSGCILEPQP